MKKEPSIEELVEIAESEQDSTEKYVPNYYDIGDFFAEYELTPGPHPVFKSDFYGIYYNWSSNPVAKNLFHNEVYQVLDSDKHHYYLNRNLSLTLKERLDVQKKRAEKKKN